jgi:RNA ligase
MKHLALQYDFERLLAGLQVEVEKGYVNKINSGELSLFNYRQSCQNDKAWNDFSLVARGIVLHIPSQKIVALPFPKFFNYGENGYDLPELDFYTTEKLDGSLGVIYFWNGRWCVNTRGAFDSWQSNWAEEWLKTHIKTENLDKSTTYLVEIIIRENRIVINYQFEGLVLLSAYQLNTGEELTTQKLDSVAAECGFNRPLYYSQPFEELLHVAESLPANQEGFVVRFSDGTRVKIKGAEYCRIHRLISDVTPLGVWRSIMAGDDLDKMKLQLPEEYRNDYDRIILLMNNQVDEFVGVLKDERDKASTLSDKELGLSLKEFSPISQKFLFKVRKQDFLEKIKVAGDARERFFKAFRPTGNILDGYDPTGAVNRFMNEQDV